MRDARRFLWVIFVHGVGQRQAQCGNTIMIDSMRKYYTIEWCYEDEKNVRQFAALCVRAIIFMRILPSLPSSYT